MNMRIMFVVAVISAALVGLAVPVGKSNAQTAKDLEGTWSLVSLTIQRDGNKFEVYGDNPVGRLIFDANGRYSLMVRRSTLPKYASNNRDTGSPDEFKATVQGSNAHFGTYAVSLADKAVNFRIEVCTYPNWDGTEQKRTFTLDGDQLTYVTPGTGAGGATVEAGEVS